MENVSGDGAERAALVRNIMRRQSRLSLRIAAVFVGILVGLPLLNLVAPGAMATPVGGFPLTWLLLALLFYPVTWLLSWLFVSGSDRAEDEIVAEMRRGEGLQTLMSPSPPPTPQPTTKRKLFVEDDEA